MKKNIKRLVLAVAGLFMIILVSGCAGNKTVVTMKGGRITQQEYYDEMKKSSSGKSTLQTMIISKALDQQYGKYVSDSQVNKQYNKYKDQYGAQFSQILQQNGLTTDSFKKSIRTNLLTKVALRKNKKVTNKDLKKQWKTYQPKIKVRHILVDKESTAKEVIAKLDKGENFSKLAKEYSTDTGTKANGGKLAAFSNTDSNIDSSFRNAAFKLNKKGEYTKTPVKTSYGYDVIELIDKPAKGKMKDHKKELTNQIYANWMQDSSVMQSVISKVLKRADVSIKDNDLKDILSGYLSTGKSSSNGSTTGSN